MCMTVTGMLLDLRATIADPKFNDEQVLALFKRVKARGNCSQPLREILSGEMKEHRPELFKRLGVA